MKRTVFAVGSATCVGFMLACVLFYAPVATHNDTSSMMVSVVKK